MSDTRDDYRRPPVEDGSTDAVVTGPPTMHDITSDALARLFGEPVETADLMLRRLTSAGYTVRRFTTQDIANLDDLCLDEFDLPDKQL